MPSPQRSGAPGKAWGFLSSQSVGRPVGLQPAAAPGKPFHREQIIEQLYGDALSLNDKNISNHINRIRTKIEPNPEEPLYVMTLRGVGYYFNDALPQG